MGKVADIAAVLILAIAVLLAFVQATHWVHPLFHLLSNLELLLVVLAFMLSFYGLFRRRTNPWAALALLVSLGSFSTGSASQPNDANSATSFGMKVLSLNVNQFANDSLTADEVANYIRSMECDVVLLQEFGLYHKWPDLESMAADFQERLGMPHAHFSPHKDNIFGTAIFSKHPLVESELIYHQLGDCNEAWKHVVDVNGNTLAIANIHLQSYNWAQRESRHFDPLSVAGQQVQQIRQIDQAMAQHPMMQLRVGDFNATSGSPAFCTWNNQLDQAVAQSAWRFVPSFLAPPVQIDQVWHSKDLNATVAFDHGAPSDHAALIIWL